MPYITPAHYYPHTKPPLWASSDVAESTPETRHAAFFNNNPSLGTATKMAHHSRSRVRRGREQSTPADEDQNTGRVVKTETKNHSTRQGQPHAPINPRDRDGRLTLSFVYDLRSFVGYARTLHACVDHGVPCENITNSRRYETGKTACTYPNGKLIQAIRKGRGSDAGASKQGQLGDAWPIHHVLEFTWHVAGWFRSLLINRTAQQVGLRSFLRDVLSLTPYRFSNDDWGRTRNCHLAKRSFLRLRNQWNPQHLLVRSNFSQRGLAQSYERLREMSVSTIFSIISCPDWPRDCLLRTSAVSHLLKASSVVESDVDEELLESVAKMSFFRHQVFWLAQSLYLQTPAANAQGSIVARSICCLFPFLSTTSSINDEN